MILYLLAFSGTEEVEFEADPYLAKEGVRIQGTRLDRLARWIATAEH